MRSKQHKIDKSSVLDFGSLGIADEVLLAGQQPRLLQHQLERPIIRVNLAKICQDSPFQTRQEVFDPKAHPEDEELLESVAANGVLEPIMVLELSSAMKAESYQIVFGHRRVAASRLAGLDDITAIIARDEEEARILTLAENMGGRALTPYEKALALAGLQELHPDLSIRALGDRTGIPFQTISTLLRAYQDSPPALRGLFAEGMAPGTILKLKSLFLMTPEEEHMKLGNAVKGLTRRQAQGIHALVERGAAPHDAIQATLEAELKQRIMPIRPPELEQETDIDGTDNAVHQTPAPLPSADDRKAIEDICEYTGASRAKVRRLIEQAALSSASRENLILACAYAGNRGDEHSALQMAIAVSEDSDVNRLLKRCITLRRRFKKVAHTIQDVTIREFANTIIFGK